jgi:hypothetical protein
MIKIIVSIVQFDRLFPRHFRVNDDMIWNCSAQRIVTKKTTFNLIQENASEHISTLSFHGHEELVHAVRPPFTPLR